MPIPPINTHQSEQQLFTQPEPQQPRPTYRSGDSTYNPKDYGWDYDEIFDFPPGKYFLGDPSFVVGDIDLTEGFYDENEIPGVGRLVRFPLSQAGGWFDDEEAYAYYSASGAFGVVSIAHLAPGHWAALRDVGRIVEFEDEFQVQLDSQVNFFLGWNWIFSGQEVPPEVSCGCED